jgi:hypothetical protein
MSLVATRSPQGLRCRHRRSRRAGMETFVSAGEKIERDQASGATGSGDGESAGVACRMEDGSIVDVPESRP